MSGFSDFGDFYSAVGFPSGSPADTAVPLPQPRPQSGFSDFGAPSSGVLNTPDVARMPPPPSSGGEIAVAPQQQNASAAPAYDFQGRLKKAIGGLDMRVENGRVVSGGQQQGAPGQQQGAGALAARAKQMLQMGMISQDQHDKLMAAATNPNPSAGPSLAWGQ